ncbi:MAG: hypothetical protein PUB87_05585 [Eubacteriaceae bacterium]|nr:hypothetical protein [Eubacteriaceae bacterium]
MNFDNVSSTPIYVQQVFDAVKFNMQGMRTFTEQKFSPCIPRGHRIKKVADIRCRRVFNPENVDDCRNLSFNMDTSISGASFLRDCEGNYIKVVGADGTYSERIMYAESQCGEDSCKGIPVFGTHNVSVFGNIEIELDLILCDSCGNDSVFTVCTEVTIAEENHPMILTNFFEICMPSVIDTAFLPRFTEFCNSSCEARLATNNCGRDLTVDECGKVCGNLLVAICLTCEKKIIAPVQLCVLSTGYLDAPMQKNSICSCFPSLFPSNMNCCENISRCDDTSCDNDQSCKGQDDDRSRRPQPRR